jgi:uncharacterized protein (UPF0548 family)
MFLLGSPSDERIRRILAAHRRSPFSYANTGATRTLLPAGYQVRRDQAAWVRDRMCSTRRRTRCGNGRCSISVWVRLYWPLTPVAVRSVIAVVVGRLGVWMVNVCRIVYVVDEPRRYGFAYGTLSHHAEAGEERFMVEWRDDNSVWYQVLAFSREKHLLAKLAYPLARRLQKKLRRDSGIAMQRAATVDRRPADLGARAASCRFQFGQNSRGVIQTVVYAETILDNSSQ